MSVNNSGAYIRACINVFHADNYDSESSVLVAFVKYLLNSQREIILTV